MEYSKALVIAENVRAALAPFCERIEIAGSVRREKPEVHDIELVAIPRFEDEKDLFGNTLRGQNILIAAANKLGIKLKGGERYLQIELPQGIDLDLFMVIPPAQWGVQLAIRTGCAGFSHWLVTPRRYGGAMPSHLQCKDGAIVDSANQIIPTPEEKDLFDLLKVEYIDPQKRFAPKGFEV